MSAIVVPLRRGAEQGVAIERLISQLDEALSKLDREAAKLGAGIPGDAGALTRDDAMLLARICETRAVVAALRASLCELRLARADSASLDKVQRGLLQVMAMLDALENGFSPAL